MSPSPRALRPHYRILAVSDQVEPRLYGPTLRDVVQEVDLIIGCGDLPYYYLEYLLSVLNRPLYYTHGNHDRPEHRANKSVVREPPGGINLHRQIHQVEGLLIAGLEGSHRYNSNPAYQYTQNEMWAQVLSLAPQLLLNRLLYGRSLDLLVTHSPPFGIHDASDRPHIGFKAFLWLLRWFRPRYMLHGHQHVYRPSEITQTRFEQTEIINVYPFRLLDLVFG
ncbi:MAG: metallophosphoesterase [Caldilineales bacterium]|nr:metallophosphoesterase [Caldilineales bacterium]